MDMAPILRSCDIMILMKNPGLTIIELIVHNNITLVYVSLQKLI